MIISKKTPKHKVLELGKQCDRSNHCCRFTTGFLAEDDLQKISKFLNISEKELRDNFLQEVKMFNTMALRPKSIKGDKPYGPCVFFDNTIGCKIHPVKPLQCKLYTCKSYGFDLTQWFYLNHLVNANDPHSVREYALFLKSNEPIPGGSLEELVPDKKRLKRILSYKVFKEEKE